MKCLNCNKEVAPLILFNGSWRCPKCKKKLFPDQGSVLKITSENYEMFANSERIFYKNYLLSQADLTERKKQLELAVALCKDAAFQYNPHALVNLGYYYEHGYIRSLLNKTDHLRSACRFYRAVAYNNNRLESDLIPEDKLDALFLQIKSTAEENLYHAMHELYLEGIFDQGKKPPLADAQAQLKRLYDPKLNPNDKQSLLKKVSETVVDGVWFSQVGNDAVQTFEVLRSPKQLIREPIFGIFKVEPKTLKDLATVEFTDSTERIVRLEQLFRKYTFRVAAETDGEITRDGLVEMPNARAMNAFAQEKNADTYHLFFFRNEYKMKKSKQKSQKLLKLLSASSNELIFNLIKYRLEYAFSEDDIVAYGDDFKQSLSHLILDKQTDGGEDDE